MVHPKKTKTTTWEACRDLCNTNEKCEYFKWKVNYSKFTIEGGKVYIYV